MYGKYQDKKYQYQEKYSCDGKAEFSAAITPVSVSHDPSEIILICWFGAQ